MATDLRFVPLARFATDASAGTPSSSAPTGPGPAGESGRLDFGPDASADAPDAKPDVVDVVRAEIDRLVVNEERDPAEIAVLTFSTRLRERLLADAGLVRWEDHADGLLCENVHRVKGLEFDTVILVTETTDVPDGLLYVGISRAVSELVLIAPPELGIRLGLKPTPPAR